MKFTMKDLPELRVPLRVASTKTLPDSLADFEVDLRTMFVLASPTTQQAILDYGRNLAEGEIFVDEPRGEELFDELVDAYLSMSSDYEAHAINRIVGVLNDPDVRLPGANVAEASVWGPKEDDLERWTEIRRWLDQVREILSLKEVDPAPAGQPGIGTEL